jgi:hypothetical protein
MKRIIFLLIPVLFTSGSLFAQKHNSCPFGADPTNDAMNLITEVIVYDVFSPPVTSRIYAYTSIAGYTAYAYSTGMTPFTERLNEFPAIPKERPNQPLCPSLVSTTAMFMTAKSFLFSEAMVDSSLNVMVENVYKPVLDQATIDASIAYGSSIAKQIIAWSAKDGYRDTRKMERYTPVEGLSYWEPTPPDHADAVEPYWTLIRPFVMDSAAQCKPDDLVAFSELPGSTFYKNAVEVMETKNTLTDEQIATVWFWDDNPFVTVHQGHLVYAKKKVSPAGHWIGITQIAIEQSGADMEKALRSYAMVSIGLADAFISCWDEKYRSNLLRPVTYINKYIDPTWEPYLQTPPFPEFTSGHSVISASASMILTELYGDNFTYTDNVLSKYGQPTRTFSSFVDAANEAAYSRIYGGIHYRPGIEVGVSQGRKVAAVVIAELL